MKIIYGLGIANVGLSNAKLICKEFNHDPEAVKNADEERLSSIDKIGPVIAKSFVDYFSDENNRIQYDRLVNICEFEAVEAAGERFAGMTFVITGSVLKFANRNEVKDFIEANGGKVTGSVTNKTTYLINNDTTSNSSKNKKAKELGIPIISEEEFLQIGE